MRLDELNRIYFVGIGGIGMSALARYFNGLGKEIFGYDRVRTVLTQQLEAEGMQIHYEDDVKQIPAGVDLVIYTPAIPADHKELQYFQAAGYPLKKRAAVLGMISKHQKTIGVAGTHGKTTTSAILTHLLRTGGIDCTAFLGGIAQNLNSNFVAGQSEWVVMEADEFDRSFLHLHPHVAVITSMDADHLDIYGDGEQLKATFVAYAQQTKDLLLHEASLSVADADLTAKKQGYGLDVGQVQVQNVQVKGGYFVFDWIGAEQQFQDLEFTLPGEHNVLNAAAAIGVAVHLGCTEASIRAGLKSFKGIQRRFEWVIQSDDLAYIDDYAHHPTELEAAIKAARMLFPERKLTGVFQPHLYSRTQDFSTGFAKALEALDEVILLDIYPARELPIEGVTSQLILDQMQHEQAILLSKADLMEHLKQQPLEVLMTLGAGDIGAMVPDIGKMLEKS